MLVRKISLIIILVFSLQACGTRFTYNQLDWLIPWHMDSYVSLDREQKQVLHTKLEPVLNWHRHQELLRYIDILDSIEQDLAHPISSDTVIGWLDAFKEAADRVEISLLEMSLELGETLTDEQINNFRSNLREKQAEYEKEYLERDAKEYSKDNYKSLSKNTRRFVGRLNSEQKQVLKQASFAMHRFDSYWLEERRSWLDTLDTILDRKPGWQQALIAAHKQREELQSLKYQKVLEHNIQVLSESIANILNSLDNKQRTQLGKQIDKLRTDFRILSEAPNTDTSINNEV